MLTLIDWDTASNNDKKRSLTRVVSKNTIQSQVERIIQKVREFGDEALLSLTQEFDGVDLSSFIVPKTKLAQAKTDEKSKKAIEAAINTISKYHECLLPQGMRIETAKGIQLERVYRPIQAVGLYVPGGKNTPLISSLLMQAIPARIAGCPLRIVCTPPNLQGEVDNNLLAAAHLCGIEAVYSIGGAQAVAAMAYGTQSIPKVDKIFGPGNAYVTEAKVRVSLDAQGAAMDMPAGPSEVMILADDKANPAFIAADLLAQAEHGPDSQVLLLCETKTMAMAVNQAIDRQLTRLSRKALIQQSLQHSAIIICKDKVQQLSIINEYAPEHLIINREDANTWVEGITSAGTIFLGPWAAETMGDYISGSNHVLPTNGYARQFSGLSTKDFLKEMTVQSIEAVGLQTMGAQAVTLAKLEGLDAHANAVELRLQELGALL